MNRLIKFVISFVLPLFCLLISVSYAFEFVQNSTVTYKSLTTIGPSNTTSNFDPDDINYTIAGYTFLEIRNTVKNYMLLPDNNEYAIAFNSMLSDIDKSGKAIIVTQRTDAPVSDRTFYIYVFDKNNFDVGVGDSFYISLLDSNYSNTLYRHSYSNYTNLPGDVRLYTFSKSNELFYDNNSQINTSFPERLFASSVSIKNLDNSNTSAYCNWDGTYFYEASIVPDEPEAPSLPSNSEIAQAVQNFYNSDYYKNNKDFSDFMVMYNINTGYFSFIGHTLGSNLGQVIVPPNYMYQGYKYNKQWWKFYIDENQGALPYGTKYYLYSTNDFGKTFVYDGFDTIANLVTPHWSISSIIVYSTTDYPVRTYLINENTGEYTYTDGIIEGDLYTYDETLDPTTNEYNPLENFVPIDPTQSILGDVDFSEINKTFEENKDILNIENASWLFTANNKLVGYFIGFLSLLIVFLIIIRVLGG